MSFIWEGPSGHPPLTFFDVSFALILIFLHVAFAFVAAYLLRKLLKKFFKKIFSRKYSHFLSLIVFFLVFLVLFFFISIKLQEIIVSDIVFLNSFYLEN